MTIISCQELAENVRAFFFRSFASAVLHEQAGLGEILFVKIIIQRTNRGCCSTGHESRTMTFDQTPFITLLCSVWYVGADPTVKEACTENGVRSRAYNLVVPCMSR